MSENIQFEADQSQLRNRQVFNQTSTAKGMTGWLIEKGIIKDESQAGVVLGGIVVLNLVLTAVVIYFFIF